jgi:uroporphyrinogen-III synthase
MDRVAPCVVLTRPVGKNEALAQTLRQQGVNVIEQPVLALSGLPFDPDRFAWPEQYDLLVFVSGAAVEHYMTRWHAALPCRPVGAPADASSFLLAAVGPATAQALDASPELRAARLLWPKPPLSFDSEGLWVALQPHLATIRRVLIVRGQSGREWLAEQFEQRKVSVDRYTVYKRQPVVWSPAQRQAVQEACRYARNVVFQLTSSQAVDAFVEQMRQAGLLFVLTRARFVVIHERVAARLRSQLRVLLGPTVSPEVKLCAPDDDAMRLALRSSASF